MAKNNKANMGSTKRSTDDLIDSAIAQQNDWLENRRTYTRSFLKKLNVFSKNPSEQEKDKEKNETKNKNHTGLLGYWFPVLCAFVVIFIAIWVAFVRVSRPSSIILVPDAPVQVSAVQKKEIIVPEFDIVRIDKDGDVIVAGRWLPNKSVSVMVNGRVVATEITNNDGEFVYSPKNAWKPGNYTIVLVGTDPEVKSAESVFLYVSEYGVENSVSLLVTKNGSTLLQAPSLLQDNDLNVSKIDYLDSGRIVVTGDGLPRLRVSLTLNGEYVGFARVSDYKHFGFGADVGELESGKEYELVVRMHDGDGRTVGHVLHKFIMPEMTGDDDTYYTVRRGDCLWIIARNFMRRGVLFSIIAEKNNIKNPDLIFPKQTLQIPVNKK